jgi:hypothetical protein
MAREAFSDPGVAAVLNELFIPIKVDREERPDIDQYCMAYLVSTTGSGGWPLNLVLTSERTPIFAGTYFSVGSERGQPGFADVLRQVSAWYAEHKGSVIPFRLPPEEPQSVVEHQLLSSMRRAFDTQNGGFGRDSKFPPHSTLLFLLTLLAAKPDDEADRIVRTTLDAMSLRGLHDHLQGGFFRYCVDRAWTIPHFEKMLYDQAMLLWSYSLASRVLGSEWYGVVADGIVTCLHETFEENGLYVSAHDADTDHEEGATYVWTMDEWTAALSPSDLSELQRVYAIDGEPNFDGKMHLRKSTAERAPSAELKLLKIRRKREQPFVDRKIVTSWNALAGIALLQHWRHRGAEESKARALDLWHLLREKHDKNGVIAHASIDGKVSGKQFLEDVAAMLLFATYLYEETWNDDHRRAVEDYERRLEGFRENDQWFENEASDDFHALPARTYDQPIPSGASLAEYACARAALILGREPGKSLSLRYPLESDFFNLEAFLQDGNLQELHSPERFSWGQLPVNVLFLPGTEYQDCSGKQCRRFNDRSAFLNAIGPR